MYLVKNADFQLIELYVSEKCVILEYLNASALYISAGISNVIITCYLNTNG